MTPKPGPSPVLPLSTHYKPITFVLYIAQNDYFLSPGQARSPPLEDRSCGFPRTTHNAGSSVSEKTSSRQLHPQMVCPRLKIQLPRMAVGHRYELLGQRLCVSPAPSAKTRAHTGRPRARRTNKTHMVATTHPHPQNRLRGASRGPRVPAPRHFSGRPETA
jgi:hypothetical protein